MKPERAHGCHFFATPLGPCALAWTPRGICGFLLPGAASADAARFPEACRDEVRRPPEAIRALVSRVKAHLSGRPDRFADVALDLSAVPAPRARIYLTLREVPPGETLPYGELARRAGRPGAARSVGTAMAKNPLPLLVPCHRVVGSGGRIGGFSAPGGENLKRRLLELEGALPPAVVARRGGKSPAPAGDRAKPGEADPSGPWAEAVAHLRRADPALARAIDRAGPCALRPDGVSSVFQALLESIVYQQLTGKAAATIFGRLKARVAAGGAIRPEALLAAPEEDLRAAGLSRAKCAACRDLAQRALRGEIPTVKQLARMSDGEIVERLLPVRGVGRWTVEMLLIFRLGRPDVLPVDDYGVRKGFARAFGLPSLPSPRELAAHGERWRPHRTVASWYLWRAAEEKA